MRPRELAAHEHTVRARRRRARPGPERDHERAAACRQLASSARRRIRASQAPATPAAHQAAIVKDFKQAWEAKDIGALIGLLDPAPQRPATAAASPPPCSARSKAPSRSRAPASM